VLCSSLSAYDWSSILSKKSSDAAFDSMNFAITQARDLRIFSGNIKKHKYPFSFY
jgi:hypothetical protein